MTKTVFEVKNKVGLGAPVFVMYGNRPTQGRVVSIAHRLESKEGQTKDIALFDAEMMDCWDLQNGKIVPVTVYSIIVRDKEEQKHVFVHLREHAIFLTQVDLCNSLFPALTTIPDVKETEKDGG